MSKLVSLIYVSSATKHFDEQQLTDLLKASRLTNELHKITGMLLYHEGHMMQVIEGEEIEINQLFNNIQKDKRHNRVMKLICKPIEEREFAEWNMSYLNISSESTEGFSDFLNAGKNRSDSGVVAGKAKKILTTFRDNFRELSPNSV